MQLIIRDYGKEQNYDNDESWVFQKREDEEASVSFRSTDEDLYIKDSNGNDLDAFTIVAKNMESVEILYDNINSIKDHMEHKYPELKGRELISIYDMIPE